MSSRRALWWALTLSIPVFVSAIAAPVQAQPVGEALPQLEEPRPPRDSLAIRIGFVSSGLFSSGQGRPFFYLDTGLRYKSDQFYIDLKLPAFVAGLDWALYQLQEMLGVGTPFNLFEASNEPIHYGAYLEPAHLRLGQTFAIGDPDGAGLRLTGGVFMLADFVFFDLALFNRDPESFESIEDPEAHDPFVVAPGGFVAIGGDLPLTAWDFALGIGPDIYQDDAYVPAGGVVVYGDLEVQIDPLRDIGAYIRTRFSTYTHTSPVVWTMIASYGFALRLL